MRFLIECEWTGYVTSQRHVVHREVCDAKRAARLKNIHAIRFGDNTSLILSIRELKSREKVNHTIDGYNALLRDVESFGFQGPIVTVAEMEIDRKRRNKS